MRRVETKQLLVVDDDADARELLGELLESSGGYQVVRAGSRQEAEQKLAELRIDAALLDVDLGDGSGLDILRTIRAGKTALALPVIMVTAHDKGEDIAAALGAGANDYVAKPIDLRVLLARLATHLHLADLARLKDDVLRMASHDLKNPLTAVMGNAELILDVPLGRPVDEDLHDSARAVLRRSQYMQRLVNDFLDMQAARDGQLRLELAPLSLAELAGEIIAEQQDHASARGLQLVARGEPALARADAARLAQVLHNLVGNAIKFARSRGHIELVTSLAGEHAVIEVGDDGPGLGEHPERLFAEHVRGDARPATGERSTGLGLSIARVLVEEHGGTISARNREDGPGAIFRVALPRA
jgi:two-component system sensor histidine kinase/response regulator